MGNTGTIIGIASIFVAIVIIIIIFRKLKFGSVIKSAITEGKNFFSDIANLFKTDNKSGLAGQTVETELGSVSIPEDTEITDGIIKGSPPTLETKGKEQVEKKVKARQQKLGVTLEKNIEQRQTLNPQEQKELVQQRNIVAKLGQPRDDEGFIRLPFTTDFTEQRLRNVILNKRNKKTTKFGGFKDIISQEEALRKAIEESRQEFGDFRIGEGLSFSEFKKKRG